MLTHPTLEKLEQLRFHGMAGALREQLQTPDMTGLSFDERLGLLVDREMTDREDRRLKSRLRRAKLRQQASMEDLDYSARRGLDKQLLLHLASCDWVRRHHNVIVTGATGVGKSYVACALAHKACLLGFGALYHRLPRLLEDLELARGDGRYLKLLRQLSKVDVLVLDDWGLMGTDFTIGFSTAVQTAVEAVDKVRDTAESHERMFLVEVMGRHSGFIAVHTALAAAAECVCIPETVTDIPAILRDLRELKARGKGSVMMIVAEGDEEGGALKLNEALQAAGNPFSTRCIILGHLQRGGSPSPEDRILASSVGDFAVESILAGRTGVMAGVIGGQPTLTRFEDTYAQHKPIPAELLSLIERLAR